ncbi:MAG: TfuA-like protein [Gammaproteobacteria bacterium]|nr:TfuA-like protein [Gammaproteobacteria bacterium]
MTACVFIGPSLAVAQAREVLDANYLPPVRQGDVYRAVARWRPRAIGIIDGYFHQVPSVWHKEILWAMAEGVHVFGSASMGALRAAELEQFGMQGVGEVFTAFRDRVIEDDDEVAVVHGPPETGFLAASEAMVNIRRTLADAQAQGVVAATTQEALQGIAKALFYPKRGYPEILKRGAAEGLPADQLSALRAWLEHGRVDLKRRDALKMLTAMRDLATEDPPPKRVDYAFEHTTMWEAAIAQSDAGYHETVNDAERTAQEWLLDELRLDGHTYHALIYAALLRLLARREADRGLVEVGDAERKQHATDFRIERGLHFGRDLDQWLEERDLDREAWEKLVEDEALVNKLGHATRAQLECYVIDELRANGDYVRLAARGRTKRQALLAAEDSRHGYADTIEDLRALTWYFEQRLGTGLPGDIDTYAMRQGFASTAAFQRAVLREYRFQLVNDGVRAG